MFSLFCIWGNLSGRTKASGGKLFAKSLAKNFKTLIFIKQNLIMSRCEHECEVARAEQGSAGALPLIPKFLEKFEKPFFKKVFQETPNAN